MSSLYVISVDGEEIAVFHNKEDAFAFAVRKKRDKELGPAAGIKVLVTSFENPTYELIGTPAA